MVRIFNFNQPEFLKWWLVALNVLHWPTLSSKFSILIVVLQNVLQLDFLRKPKGGPLGVFENQEILIFFSFENYYFKKYYWTLKEIIIKKVINCWFALHGALPWDKIFELKNYKNKSKNNTKGGPLDEFEFLVVLQMFSKF